QPVVVLSAISGVTDRLLRAMEQALQQESTIAENINAFAALHRRIAAEAISSPPIRTETQMQIDGLLSRLERLLYGIAYTGECTPRTRDLILTFGERMAVHLLAGRLNAVHCPARVLYAHEIDLVAHGAWGRGTADVAQVRQHLPQHIQPLVAQGVIPVITGFFGRTDRHLPLTFGRGGTDYSAAVIADALGVQQLEVWKDVDGFLTTAPEITTNGNLIQYLSYEEAAELAYFGAKILHPRCVEPLVEKKIPLLIKNTFKIDCEGTIIGPEKLTQKQIIKSVTFDKDIAVLRVYGASVGYQVGLLKNLVSALSDDRINIKSVITSQTCINLLIDRQDLAESYEQLKQLKLDYVEQIEAVENIALIAVVGEGLAETSGLAARVFSVVAKANTNIEMISSGASRVAFYFIIKRPDLEATVHAIHQEFFGADQG
ncbi:aspartate kinase, partial [candidate division KSB1 bacterium]|nr:aspartate kinase [candidate division KSB1 bacterium]